MGSHRLEKEGTQNEILLNGEKIQVMAVCMQNKFKWLRTKKEKQIERADRCDFQVGKVIRQEKKK